MNYNSIILKHQMHSGRDLHLKFNVDTDNKIVYLFVELIDTQLLRNWLQIHQLNRINEVLKTDEKPQLDNLNDFTFKLAVENCETEFTMELFKSEIDWQQDAIVIKPTARPNYD